MWTRIGFPRPQNVFKSAKFRFHGGTFKKKRLFIYVNSHHTGCPKRKVAKFIEDQMVTLLLGHPVYATEGGLRRCDQMSGSLTKSS